MTETVTASPSHDPAGDQPAQTMMLAEGETTLVELSEADRVILLMGFGGLLLFGAALLVTTWGRDS